MAASSPTLVCSVAMRSDAFTRLVDRYAERLRESTERRAAAIATGDQKEHLLRTGEIVTLDGVVKDLRALIEGGT